MHQNMFGGRATPVPAGAGGLIQRSTRPPRLAGLKGRGGGREKRESGRNMERPQCLKNVDAPDQNLFTDG